MRPSEAGCPRLIRTHGTLTDANDPGNPQRNLWQGVARQGAIAGARAAEMTGKLNGTVGRPRSIRLQSMKESQRNLQVPNGRPACRGGGDIVVG